MNQWKFWIARSAESISWLRFVNLVKLHSSFLLSRILRRNLHWGMPSSISIEPTTSCNLQCPECPSGLRQFSRPTGKIEEQTIRRIIDQFGKYLMYVTFYFQGEPFLHKDFSRFVKMLKAKRILVGTSTNAHFLDQNKAKEIIDSGLDRLIISLDGTTAETYEQYRKGGNFDQVVTNIKSMVKIRKELNSTKPFIELQFIVFKHNEHQIKEIKTLGKSLGVDLVSLKTAQLYEFEKGNPLMPGMVKYARYEEYENGKYRIKSELPNHCYRSWDGNVITWDGNIAPCCFDKDAKYTFGNILKEDYFLISKNNQYSDFRSQILRDRSKIDICRNCSEGI